MWDGGVGGWGEGKHLLDNTENTEHPRRDTKISQGISALLLL